MWSICVRAQEVKVLSFKSNPMDLSASTHPRYDINNDAGALVKVLLAEPNVKFEGDIIGTPEYKNTEYWVYLTPGSKFLVVKAPNAIPLQVSFVDNKLSSAQSKMTYELVLSRVGQVSLTSLAYSQEILDKVAEGKRLYDNKDYKVAYQCFHLAAELGNSEAQYYLGECYYNGRGVTQVDTEAIMWYRKAAEQGHAIAQCNLGLCYEKGNGVKQDYIEAFKWYRKSAEQGYAIAQCNLGLCYYYGKKIPQNCDEVFKWYSKSADQGYAVAQNNLGNSYENGQGVAQDYAEAAKWYRKSAEQGYVYALYNLGRCYEYGMGVTQNHNDAMNWYSKAADKGHKEAKEKLNIHS